MEKQERSSLDKRKEETILNRLQSLSEKALLTLLLSAGLTVTSYAQDTKELPPVSNQTEKTIQDNRGYIRIHSTLIIKGQEITVENLDDGTMRLHGFTFQQLPDKLKIGKINGDVASVGDWFKQNQNKLKNKPDHDILIQSHNEEQTTKLKTALTRISLELAKSEGDKEAIINYINNSESEQYIEVTFKDRY